MRLTRHFPKTYETLQRLVQQAAHDADSVVMQAGHFLLYFDKETGKIIPCIPEALDDPRHEAIRADYAQFPMITWRLGLRLLDSLAVANKRIMVVVNDWQYLGKDSNRAEFYAQQKCLPKSYEREMLHHSKDITLFQPKLPKSGESTFPFFGEMNLRNRYRGHVSKLIKAGKLPENIVRHSSNGTVTCSFQDLAGVQREVYCSEKMSDCAGEVAEMIHDANKEGGATCFISLYPLVCREFVELGSQLAVELLGSSCKTVLNLGFQSTSVTDEDHLIATTEATLHWWPDSSHP